MNKFFFFIVFSLSFSSIFAQELQMEIKVISPVNSTADPQLFKNLEAAMFDFFNRTKWTDQDFQNNEKIKASLQITITSELGPNSFQGDFIIKSSRPVFNSTYETPLLNYIDKGVKFGFNVGQPIQRSDQSYYDPLSSSLTFYAYIILGFDYDSFSAYGGDKYFNLAREVYTALPNAIKNGDPSWENQNRNGRSKYWLFENMLNPRIRPFRQSFYEYHRLGLDKMIEDPDRQRAAMLSTMTVFTDVLVEYPNAMVLQMFSDSKREEILEIFMVADMGQKQKVYDIMSTLNPAQSGKLDALKVK